MKRSGERATVIFLLGRRFNDESGGEQRLGIGYTDRLQQIEYGMEKRVAGRECWCLERGMKTEWSMSVGECASCVNQKLVQVDRLS